MAKVQLGDNVYHGVDYKGIDYGGGNIIFPDPESDSLIVSSAPYSIVFTRDEAKSYYPYTWGKYYGEDDRILQEQKKNGL